MTTTISANRRADSARLLRALHGLFAAVVVLGGCGGGSAESPASPSPAPAAPAAPAAPTPPAPPAPPAPATPAPPPQGPAHYFSDCQSGAEAACVPGNNANPGTSASAPKQNLSGFDVNSLPAGAQVLFARGGAWTEFRVVLRNLNATPTAPIVFDSYTPSWGGSAAPWLKATTSGPAGFEFGTWQDLENDGGYLVRNLKLDGQGVSDWGLWLRDNLRHVTVENVEITGFEIGVHTQSGAPHGVTSFTLRASFIHHNSSMGMLGSATDMVVENNTFADNNFSGSAFNHAIYLGGHGRNGVVRGNSFTNNSVNAGECTGGNLTVHGQWDGLVIEGNTITQAASAGGCYGISINSAYASAEWFRNLVVRGNTIVNLGNCSICITSAPGVVIENNVVVNTQARYHAGILLPDREPGAGDDVDGGAVIRNNSIYLAQPSAGEGISSGSGSGSNVQVVSNLIYFGAAANNSHRCFAHRALAHYTAFDNNLCHHAGANGSWSASFGTLAAAGSAGFDSHGQSADPLFVALPSAANSWSDQLQATSPALNAGHTTLSSTTDRLGATRSLPDIGSRERQ